MSESDYVLGRKYLGTCERCGAETRGGGELCRWCFLASRAASSKRPGPRIVVMPVAPDTNYGPGSRTPIRDPGA